tara:strand:- start:136 stop:327 length:192 start_codon:yes stop_codon:yes gene_type:complete
MDNNNYKDLLKLASSIEEQLKINYILQNQENLQDPYYGGIEAFDKCFSLFKNVCERIANILKR